jgi:hypothetical protein
LFTVTADALLPVTIWTDTADEEQLAQLDHAVATLSAIAGPPVATLTVWKVIAVPEQPAQLLVETAVATAFPLPGPRTVSALAESVTRGWAAVGMAEEATSSDAEALASSDGPRPCAEAGPAAELPASASARRARTRARDLHLGRRAIIHSSFIS